MSEPRRRKEDSLEARIVVYAVALTLVGLVGLLCWERGDDGQWQPNDDPPVIAIAVLGGGSLLCLGVNIPLAAIAELLKLK